MKGDLISLTSICLLREAAQDLDRSRASETRKEKYRLLIVGTEFETNCKYLPFKTDQQYLLSGELCKNIK